MNLKELTKIAMIAAIYTAISLVLAPISYGNIQVRIAEALTMLPIIYKNGIYGVTLGCFLTNLIGAMTGVNPTGLIDSIVGTIATLLAAYYTFKFKDILFKNIPLLSILMPVIFNFIFVGLELAIILFPNNIIVGFLICGLEVAIGELISCILGYFLIQGFKKKEIF